MTNDQRLMTFSQFHYYFFQFVNSLLQCRQPVVHNLRPHVVIQREGWRTHPLFTFFGYGTAYAGLCLYLRFFCNADVPHNTHLAANYAVFAKFGAAGDTGLRRNYCVGTDLHVVRNLDQVIQLYAFADDG